MKFLLVVCVINILVVVLCKETTAAATAEASTNLADKVASTSAVASAVAVASANSPNDNNSSEEGYLEHKTSKPSKPSEDCDDVLERLKIASNSFAFKALEEIVKSDEYDNKYGAPLYTFRMACKLGLYTYGRTLQEILNFCGAKSKHEIRSVSPLLRAAFENKPRESKYFFSANIVTDITNKFTSSFKRDLESEYANGLAENFGKPKVARRDVNKCILKETNNRVRDAIETPYIFERDTSADKLVFASGFFFQSKWQKAFDRSNITVKKYYDIENNVCKVPYVYQHTVYNYTEDSQLDAKFLLIPYAKGYLNCLVAYPNNKGYSALLNLIRKMQNPGTFRRVLKSLEPAIVKYFAPCYDNVTSYIDDVDILKKTGEIDSIFDPKTAKTEGVCENDRDLVYLDEGRQKVVINNVLSGVEPPPTICDVSYEDLKNLKSYTLSTNRPVLLIVENGGIIRTTAVAKFKCD